MTVREKLGQLIMFGFPGTVPDSDALRLIEEYKAGNIILFSHNVESAAQLKNLCQQLRQQIFKATGILPFLCIDQEGGVVSRLPEDAVSFPSAMALAATGDPAQVRTAAQYTACELAALGINCNLAPVLDVNTNPQNPVIGVRAYGSDPEEVAKFAAASIQGCLEAGVMPVAKHFPGHGDTSVDSHLGLPRVEKTQQELMCCELIPYIHAIEQKVPAIMAAHILFPRLDKHFPASMSSAVLQGLLRDTLGFQGLIVSDCFEMSAIQDHYGTPEGFVAALKAGLDLGCISHTPKLALEALDMALAAVEDGSLPMERVDQAVEHVLAAKKRFAEASADWNEVGCERHRTAARKMMEAAITRLDENGPLPEVNEHTLFLGCPAYRATFASSAPDDGKTFAQVLAQSFGANFIVTPVQPEKKQIQEALRASRPGQTVVAGSYNGHLNQGQLELIRALCAADRLVIAVALRNPYDLLELPETVWKLAAFEYTPLSFHAVKQVLLGAPAPGKLRLGGRR